MVVERDDSDVDDESVQFTDITRTGVAATEFTVGQLAARSGVAVSALHFYEREGLIASRRTSGNQRRYRRDALRRVAFIRISHRVGIPLATIKAALDQLPNNRTPNRNDWARLSSSWHDDLNERISELVALRDHLSDCIGCGCLSLKTCLLANAGDRLGRGMKDAGPQRFFGGDDDPMTRSAKRR